MAEVGDVLTRKRSRKDGWDTIRVTGHINGVLVIERAKSFGPVRTISAAVLARDYGAIFEPVESEDALARRRDQLANDQAAQGMFRRRARPSAAPPDGSPEHTFAAAAEAESKNA